jgi:hypothetical protein
MERRIADYGVHRLITKRGMFNLSPDSLETCSSPHIDVSSGQAQDFIKDQIDSIHLVSAPGENMREPAKTAPQVNNPSRSNPVEKLE